MGKFSDKLAAAKHEVKYAKQCIDAYNRDVRRPLSAKEIKAGVKHK